MSQPLISLILITYQSAPLLPAFFRSMAATAYSHYELIVVDNASQDGSAEWVRHHAPQVRLIANPTNLGFGQAANQGAAAARGAFLLFLNPDIEVLPDWLDRLVWHMQRQPNVGIMCPQTLYPPAPGDGIPTLRPAAHVVDQAAVPGCCLMIRRETWIQLGGFDPQIFLYWEDTDLCWRSWLAGWRVVTANDAWVIHARGGSGGGRGWDAEQTKNSLYTHLKLLRWRRVIWFMLGLGLGSVLKILLGRPGIVAAWRWNWQHLGQTLAQRRQLLHQPQVDRAYLERLIDEHQQRQPSRWQRWLNARRPPGTR